MRFDKKSDFDLLDKCLRIKELLCVPRLYRTTTELREYFSTEELETLPYEELLQLSEKYNVRDTMEKFVLTQVSREEYRAMSKMSDEQRLEHMLEANENPDTWPTFATSSFRTLMLNAPAGDIARRYAEAINSFEERIKKENTPLASTITKLDSLKKSLIEDYPLELHKPTRTPTKKPDSLLSAIKTGSEKVALQLLGLAGKVVKSPQARKTMYMLLLSGMIISGGINMTNQIIDGHSANSATFSQSENFDGSSSLLSPDLNDDLLSIRDNFTKFGNKIPTDEEYRDFLNNVDDFYNESFAYVALESYNTYASENGLPLGSSVTVMYDDRDSDGPRDILQITDNEGKTHSIDINDHNIFQQNSPNSVYTAERHVDNLRSDYLSAVKNGATDYDLAELKQKQLKSLEGDFTSVLDALVLDYTYEKAGLFSKVFDGHDLHITGKAPKTDTEIDDR